MENSQVVIHVRFAPDGSVSEIGERPAGAKPQEWFNLLSQSTQDCYQALAGGRGVFRVPEERLAALKAPATE